MNYQNTLLGTVHGNYTLDEEYTVIDSGVKYL